MAPLPSFMPPLLVPSLLPLVRASHLPRRRRSMVSFTTALRKVSYTRASAISLQEERRS